MPIVVDVAVLVDKESATFDVFVFGGNKFFGSEDGNSEIDILKFRDPHFDRSVVGERRALDDVG